VAKFSLTSLVGSLEESFSCFMLLEKISSTLLRFSVTTKTKKINSERKKKRTLNKTRS